MSATDFSRAILDILVVLIAAKLGGELAERLGQPAVLGELALGVVVGPSVLAWVGSTQFLGGLAQLGAILLLFEVGLQTDLAGILRVGGAAMRVACIGVVLPMALAFGVASILGYSVQIAIFLGATLTATSVGITARLLSDLKKIDTDEGRTILGAAVADDVIGLMILAVVTAVVGGHEVSVLSILQIVAGATAFLLLAVLIGVRGVPPVFRWLSGTLKVRGVLVTAAFVFCLVLAYAADLAHLAPIVGAFAAGVVLAHTGEHQQIRERITPLAEVFIPIFFLSLGALIDVRTLVNPNILGLAGLLLVVAVAGKVVAGWSGPRGSNRLAVGVGMIPRGEVGLIFASYGLARHVIGADLYSALLLVVSVTTFITPPLAKPLFERIKAPRGRQAGKLVITPRPIRGLTLGPRW